MSGSIAVIDSIPFTSGGDSFSDEAARLIAADAQVAIVLADADDGSRFLAALGDAGADDIATIIVNDAMRNPTTPQRIQALDPDFRSKILGLAPQAASEDPASPFDPPGLFAANAFDCVNLIALAAEQAGSDQPQAIADQIASVSSGGSVCTSFEICAETLSGGFQVDYNGPSGVTEIRVRGEPSRGRFDQFGFDDTGTDVWESSFIVEY
jgi:branched-chain amino acid transport system substrate-binding protein